MVLNIKFMVYGTLYKVLWYLWDKNLVAALNLGAPLTFSEYLSRANSEILKEFIFYLLYLVKLLSNC